MKEYLIAFLAGVVVGGSCNGCLESSERYQRHAEEAYVSRQEVLQRADEKYSRWKTQYEKEHSAHERRIKAAREAFTAGLEEELDSRMKKRGETYVIRR